MARKRQSECRSCKAGQWQAASRGHPHHGLDQLRDGARHYHRLHYLSCFPLVLEPGNNGQQISLRNMKASKGHYVLHAAIGQKGGVCHWDWAEDLGGGDWQAGRKNHSSWEEQENKLVQSLPLHTEERKGLDKKTSKISFGDL